MSHLFDFGTYALFVWWVYALFMLIWAFIEITYLSITGKHTFLLTWYEAYEKRKFIKIIQKQNEKYDKCMIFLTGKKPEKSINSWMEGTGLLD